MTHTIIRSLAALALVASVGCGGSGTTEQTLPDLAQAVTTDGATQPGTDGSTSTTDGGCPQPSDTCVTLGASPTHTDIINACVSADVVKEDITPFYPAQGYTGCALPASP